MLEMLKNHPELIWAMITAVMSVLYKADVLPARVEAVLKLMLSMGIDMQSAKEAATQLVKGK